MSTQLDTIRQEGLGLSQQIKELVVCDGESLQMAADMRAACKEFLKRVAALTEPVIKAARAGLDAALAQRKGLEEPALHAVDTIDFKMKSYEREQRRLAEAQRQAAETERKRLEAEAALAAALEAESNGGSDVPAAAPIPQVVFTPPVAEVPRVQGATFRSTWKAEVVDIKALIQAVAAGKADPNCLTVNQTYLNQMARAHKSTLAIPGVKAVEDRIVAGKA